RNGLLARLLEEYPRLSWLLVHNIDTLRVTLEPGVLGSVMGAGATLSFEVIPRRSEDRGGGLAKGGGRCRLLRGAGPPRAGPRLLEEDPRLRWLLVHNLDPLRVTLEPGVLGSVMDAGATLSFEVIPRRIEDRGGGLAKVGGRIRLLEGLAQPREDTEFQLRYY